MSRTRRSAKDAGTRFERAVADYLADAIGDPAIDRRAKSGAKDRGDIANVSANGVACAIECKDVARLDLAGWLAEAEAERANAGAGAAVVVHKRRGAADPGRQYVAMTLADFARIAKGEI